MSKLVVARLLAGHKETEIMATPTGDQTRRFPDCFKWGRAS
jgi:hypothetical protein